MRNLKSYLLEKLVKKKRIENWYIKKQAHHQGCNNFAAKIWKI